MTMRISVREHVSGPMFDGQAEAAAHQWAEATVKELARRGQEQIKARALLMDKSGRGGTGRAAAGVLLFDRGLTQVIFGEMKEGEVWWPWLEGTSKRNSSTSFSGYHTFSNTRARLARSVQAVAEEQFRRFLPEMGGDG